MWYYAVNACLWSNSGDRNGPMFFDTNRFLFVRKLLFHLALLWTAPENIGPPVKSTRPGDVYSFGIIMSEVINRSAPFGSYDGFKARGTTCIYFIHHLYETIRKLKDKFLLSYITFKFEHRATENEFVCDVKTYFL